MRYMEWRAPGALTAILGYTREDCKFIRFIVNVVMIVVL